MREIVLEARTRRFGVPRSMAAAMPASTVLGLFLANGALSQRQYDAGLTIERVTRAYDQALGARGYGLPGVLDRVGGEAGEESDAEIRRYRTAVGEMGRLLDAYACADDQDWRCRMVVIRVVLNDEHMPHMLEPLRLCLDVVGDEFGLARAS